MPLEITVPRVLVDTIREKLREAGYLTPDMQDGGWELACVEKRLSPECSKLLTAKFEIMNYYSNKPATMLDATLMHDIYVEMGEHMETVHAEMEACLIMYKAMLHASTMDPVSNSFKVKLQDNIISGIGLHCETFRDCIDYFKQRHIQYSNEFRHLFGKDLAKDDAMLRRFTLIEETLGLFLECADLVETPEILAGMSISIDDPRGQGYRGK